MIVRIVSWVGKLSVCCGGSKIYSGDGGGGLVSSLFCWFAFVWQWVGDLWNWWIVCNLWN
jgi:hypothetical protein